MKKTNIFLVHTQYHVILSINIIYSKYKDYNNIVFYTKGRIDKDLKSEKDFICFAPIIKNSYGTNLFLKELLKYNPERFFFFQENSSENIFLTYYLAKKNIVISLVEDGAKPYQIYKKKRLLYCIARDTLIDYKQMIMRKTLVPTIFFHNNYKYAFLKHVNELWLTFPERYVSRSNKKIIQIPTYSNESIFFLNQLFDFKPINEECVLYLGQPLRQEYREFDYKTVRDILLKFHNKKIIYKAHPLQTDDALKVFEKITNLEIVRDKAPAELYILSLVNSVIISIGSTSMQTQNPTCKFFYTKKLYKGGSIFSQKDVVNPTSHVKMIDSIDEIVF